MADMMPKFSKTQYQQEASMPYCKIKTQTDHQKIKQNSTTRFQTVKARTNPNKQIVFLNGSCTLKLHEEFFYIKLIWSAM